MCPPTPDPPSASGYPEIKGYRIVGVLGEGAVGTVYKARRVDTGVAVALKVLHAVGPKRRKLIARLVMEGRVIARLNHPGIVKGLDVGESGGRYYIAMELVDGKSIRDHLEAGRVFTEAETVEIAIKVVRALHHAARQGVVHRDVKPANLMLTADGKVKITDLGLAKDAVDLSLTRSDATVGTPQYIAPEQARDSQAVDVRSDIFSLGSTLYHMVCGQPPFSGGSLAEIITKVLYEVEPPVERLNPAVSAPFSKLLRRMLAKDPEDRYPGYGELLADLDRVRAGRDIEGVIRREEAARHSWVPWASAAAAVIVVAVVLFAWKPWVRRAGDGGGKPPPVTTGDPERVPPTPPAPSPPRWEAPLAELQGELLALVQRERYEEVQTRMDLERPRFVRMGSGAGAALQGLEDEVRRKIAASCRRTLKSRLAGLERMVRELEQAESVPVGALRAIDAERKAIDEMIRDLPGLLEVDFGAEFETEQDEIQERCRARSLAAARKGLRQARQHARAAEFVSASRGIDSLLGLDLDLFYPQVRPEIEALRDELVKLRAEARERFREAYRMFQAGFESRLASWQYQRAEQELRDFEERVRPWQAEAPRESEEISRLLQQDRNDFEGVMRIWELACRRLEAVIESREPVRLAFGTENSQKVIEALEGEKYPEVIRVRFRVGGSSLEKPLTDLNPESVVEDLAVKAGRPEPRWLGLFYYYASRRPDLHPEEAKALVAKSVENFRASGGPGPRYEERIAEATRVLNATERERLRWALELHESALADFRNWDFTEAHAKWLRMQDRFAVVFKSKPEYRDHLSLAEKCEPLETLKRRFPGAKREHLYRERDNPLAFRLTFPLRAGAGLEGPEYAAEKWKPGPSGLERVVETSVRRGTPFPREWGVRLPIALNYKYPASVTVTVQTDPDQVMSLFGVSLGGNIAGLLSLDGIRDRFVNIQPNQVSLWTSSASPRRTDFDVFQDYEKQFQLVPGSATPPGYSYRFQLGKVHRVTLQVAEKDRTLRFIADGLERVQRKVSRLKSLGWVEVRAWNNPIVLKELVVEGVLER